ncbi:MAG: histidinol-phosphate aminotransferase [Acidobacteria bacterium]|nr:histidinol-phosphate aminotransferase [Acidobacteriota bacterium]
MKKNSPLNGVKPRVLKVPAYTLHAYDADIKMNQNENPFDFPEDLKEEAFRRFRKRQWSRYPDFVPESLKRRLGEFLGWHKDGVLVGNGSNELLQASLMVLIKSRTKVAIPFPTFSVYRLIANVLGATIVDIPLNPDMSYNVDALISGCRESGAGVLIINNPNNPTGSAIREGGFLADYPRLIITRTFSKAMGMAGLRLGYLMAHPDLAAQISKAKLPYNVNQFSLTVAEVALENLDRFRPAIETVLREKVRLGGELAKLPGLKVYPSESNFFLVEVPLAPRAVFDYLFAQGILIRDVSSYPTLSKCLRISVGTPEENDRLLSALRACMENPSVSGTASARESK